MAVYEIQFWIESVYVWSSISVTVPSLFNAACAQMLVHRLGLFGKMASSLHLTKVLSARQRRSYQKVHHMIDEPCLSGLLPIR